MEVRFPNGYWQNNSLSSLEGGSWMEATLIIETKYVELLTGKTNPVYTSCLVWNVVLGKCSLNTGCHYDGGFIASWERPKTKSDIVLVGDAQH